MTQRRTADARGHTGGPRPPLTSPWLARLACPSRGQVSIREHDEDTDEPEGDQLHEEGKPVGGRKGKGRRAYEVGHREGRGGQEGAVSTPGSLDPVDDEAQGGHVQSQVHDEEERAGGQHLEAAAGGLLRAVEPGDTQQSHGTHDGDDLEPEGQPLAADDAEREWPHQVGDGEEERRGDDRVGTPASVHGAQDDEQDHDVERQIKQPRGRPETPSFVHLALGHGHSPHDRPGTSSISTTEPEGAVGVARSIETVSSTRLSDAPGWIGYAPSRLAGAVLVPGSVTGADAEEERPDQSVTIAPRDVREWTTDWGLLVTAEGNPVNIDSTLLLLLTPILVIQLGLLIWGLYDLTRPERKVKGGSKVLWALVIIFINIIGPIIYFLFGREEA